MQLTTEKRLKSGGMWNKQLSAPTYAAQYGDSLLMGSTEASRINSWLGKVLFHGVAEMLLAVWAN